jgi:hypothetical protein
MNRWLYGPGVTGPIICQISGPFDEQRRTRLPAQCCGQPADQIYKCEQVAPPGHRCRVGEHTILHERMGNGWPCSAVEDQLVNRGGLSGWISAQGTRHTQVGT